MIEGKTTRHLGRAKALALGLLLAGLMSASTMLAAIPAHAATTFTVDTTFSGGDANLQDGACDANPLPNVQLCTLTAAIQEANDTGGVDTIEFDIPESVDPGVKTISPSSELPDITEAVIIDGYSQPGSRPNTKPVGNDANLLIELDGTNAGNGASGLEIRTDNVTVRGLIVNDFSSLGIDVRGSANKVEGNFVGTDATGTTKAGNGDGVFVANGQDNIVGGSSPAARNVISGNDQDGVRLQGTAPLFAVANKVQNNYVGTDKSGTARLGNGGTGVSVVQTPLNVIGGGEAEANVIAFNGQEGVAIRALDNGGSTNNHIQSNSIFSNGLLGIDLDGDGPTANDPKDPDLGENGLQNKPVLTSATSAGGKLTVRGKLNSTPNTRFLVEFFSNAPGEDEGKNSLGLELVNTDANGDASFVFTPAEAVSAGQSMTATATDRGLNTSEFSAPKGVVAADETAPRVIRVLPPENATGVAPGANVSAFFSEDMSANSVNANTVKLRKAGTTEFLQATVTYVAANKQALLNPKASLRPGATYVATVTVGARDVAGNLLDQDPGAAGNQPKVWKFTVRR